MKNFLKGLQIALVIFLFGCSNDDGLPTEQPINENSGGENFTTSILGDNAFGIQGSALTRQEEAAFVFGNSLFRTNWVAAPASVSSLDGLGPIFNARSCGGCHFKDGRGAPLDEVGSKGVGILWRLHLASEQPHEMYGAQIQENSLPDLPGEGNVVTTYKQITGRYADGTSYQIQEPIIEFTNLNYGPINQEYELSGRVAPHIAGLGLLEAIDVNDILMNEDEFDSNNDGISGKVIYVTNLFTGGLDLGRFGWKSQQPTIKQQNASAFATDMGLTNSLFPKTDFTILQESLYPNIIDGGNPEITEKQLNSITTYVQGLSVPAKRNTKDPTFKRGSKLFKAIQCNSCHIESYQTSNGNDIPSLDAQLIYPYTDLLLHDMGEGLADMPTSFNQEIRAEWRTPPLWGIGLFPSVNRHSRYLHDGRARNIEEAILWHGGEAEKATNKFKQLTQQEREDLIFFLKNI